MKIPRKCGTMFKRKKKKRKQKKPRSQIALAAILKSGAGPHKTGERRAKEKEARTNRGEDE